MLEWPSREIRVILTHEETELLNTVPSTVFHNTSFIYILVILLFVLSHTIHPTGMCYKIVYKWL